MNNIQLSNGILEAEISQHGAELISVRHNGVEHIWQADPQYWKRHAPILFPIVGKVWDGAYRVGSKTYRLPQHGFARDSEFSLVDAGPDYAILRLESSEATLQCFPYPFALTARYNLEGDTIRCLWQVENRGTGTMYFQIGAHPAYRYPDFDPEAEEYGFMQLFKQGQPVEELAVTLLGDSGCVIPRAHALHLVGARLPLTSRTFDRGALVLDGGQADRAVMYDRQQHPVVEMRFDAPALGIWSPQGAPFCCIEPWYGRADEEGFAGFIEQRPYIQQLPPAGRFDFRYEARF